MGSYKKIILIVLFAISHYLGYSQSVSNEVNDQLYIELFEKLNSNIEKDLKHKLAEKVIKEAKKDKHKNYLLAGYHTQALLYNDIENTPFYCDSIIDLTINEPIWVYPYEAYQIKINTYYNNQIFTKALDINLQLARYAEERGNKEYISKSHYDLGVFKRTIGESLEALKLFQKSFEYQITSEEVQDSILYLSTIRSLANTYNDLKKVDSAKYYNQLGYKIGVKYEEPEFVNHFMLNQGVTHFILEEYEVALDSMLKAKEYFEKSSWTENLHYAYYYIGSSFEKLEQTDRSLKYFKKVDSIFNTKDEAYAISKKSLQKLIDYYKDKGNLAKQLYYVNQHIKIDSIIHADEMYLSKGLYKEYDIPRLKKEKERIQTQMQLKEQWYRIGSIGVGSLLVIFLLAIAYQVHKKNLYKRKFNNIYQSYQQAKSTQNEMKNKVGESSYQIGNMNNGQELNITRDRIDEILESLVIFESEKGYLNEKTTLNSLAKKLNTNSNYLSKVVNFYKNTSFSQYLNNLRINYCIELLHTQPNLRKYTIKAIAQEVGFRTAESFSKAFYKSKGIKPSYFLKELDRKEN